MPKQPRKTKIVRVFADADIEKHPVFKCVKCSRQLFLLRDVWAKSVQHNFIFTYHTGCLNITEPSYDGLHCRGCLLYLGDFVKNVNGINSVRFFRDRTVMNQETLIDVDDISSTHLCSLFN